MVDAGAIGDVSESLKQALWEGLQADPQFANPDQIKIDSPENLTATNVPQLSVFLYRLVPEGHLRNDELRPEPPNRLRYPPMSLRLHYLLTPYVTDRADEHRILGLAMLSLYDRAIIAGPTLQGSLAGSDLELHVHQEPLNTEELSKLWSAILKPFRLSVGYQVRPVRIDSLRTRTVTRIVERQAEYGT